MGSVDELREVACEGWRVSCRPGLELAPLIAAARCEGSLLKADGVARVWRAGPLVVKRSLARPGLFGGRRAGRAGRALRWGMRFEAAGVGVARPLAALRWEGAPGDSWLVSAFVGGGDLAAGLAAGAVDGAGLGRWLAAMHGAGLTHGDLKRSNLLVEAGQLVLIDLDAAGGPGWGFERRAARDVGMLLSSVGGILGGWGLRRGFAAYVRGRGLGRRGRRRVLERAVALARKRLARGSVMPGGWRG